MIKDPVLALVLFILPLTNPAIPIDPAALAPGETLIHISLTDIHALELLMETLALNEWGNYSFKSPGAFSLEHYLSSWKKNLHVPFNEFETIFPLRKILYITTLDLHPQGTAVFDLNVILEHNGDKARVLNMMDRLFMNAPPDAQRSSYEFLGERVFSVDYALRSSVSLSSLSLSPGPEDAKAQSPDETRGDQGIMQERSYHFQYALVDGWLFLCEGQKDPMKRLLHHYKSPSPGSLSRKSSYLAVLRNIPEQAGVKIYVNMEEISSRVIDFYQKAYHKDLSPLGLPEMKALGVSLEIQPDVLRSRICLYAPPPRNGISDMLFQFSQSGFHTLEFIPSDAIAYSSCSLDLYKAYRAFVGSLELLSPDRISTFRRTLESNAQVMGFDIERDIIGQMKGEAGYYIRPPRGFLPDDSPAEVFFIPIENPELFKGVLQKFFQFLRAFFYLEIVEKNHREKNYWAISPGSGPGARETFNPVLGLFLSAHHLFVSTDIDELKNTIARLENRDQTTTGSSSLMEAMMRQYPKSNCVGIKYSQAASRSEISKNPTNPKTTLIYQTPEILFIVTEIPQAVNKTNSINPR